MWVRRALVLTLTVTAGPLPASLAQEGGALSPAEYEELQRHGARELPVQ
jgi:hypothetical protein